MELAQIVRHGSITIMAINFGVTRKCIGSIAMVSSAFDFFRDLHSADSAANAEPDRPITTMAVNQRPKFPRHGNRHGAGNEVQGAELAQLVSALQRQNQSDEERDQGRMGSAPTPVCMACDTARCKRSGLP